jgi:formyltetrahydrofolate deformylase
MSRPTFVLLISCLDRQGIVAAVSRCVFEAGCNILCLDQHIAEERIFFMRLEFVFLREDMDESDFRNQLSALAKEFSMTWQLVVVDQPKRLAIFASKLNHCLLELLWRWQSGELPVKIPLIISNHPDLEPIAQQYGLTFHHYPIDRENQAIQEQRILELLEGEVDLIVLARYMRILGPQLVNRYQGKAINIHHSFLPAFVGASPYQRAHERGVKVIGATAHYVTDNLDEGPIIEQDVIRVNHRDQIRDLQLKGRDIERSVLARAVQWHIEDRILVHGNRTIVFT